MATSKILLKAPNDTAVYKIYMPDSTGPRIVNGKNLSKFTRQPILCCYSDQIGVLFVFLIFTGQKSWDPIVKMIFTTAQGYQPIVTPTVDGNDILLSGLGNWGQGYAIGVIKPVP